MDHCTDARPPKEAPPEIDALTRARILGERVAEELECFGYLEDDQTLEMLELARTLSREKRSAILVFIHAITCRDCTTQADADRWWEKSQPGGPSAALSDLGAFVDWACESGTWECWYDRVEEIAQARDRSLRGRATA